MSFDAARDRVNATALQRFGEEHLLDGVTVRGDFVKPGKTFTLSDGMGIAARVPTLVVADGDVPADPVGKIANCEGEDYSVELDTPDGLGLTVLELQKVPT